MFIAHIAGLVISSLLLGESAPQHISCTLSKRDFTRDLVTTTGTKGLPISFSVRPAENVPDGAMWITRSYVIDTECSNSLYEYSFDRIILESGAAYIIPEAGGALIYSESLRSWRRSPRQVPKLEGGRFVDAAWIDAVPYSTSKGRYLGIWYRNSSTILATFTEGQQVEPVLVATIGAKVLSITYRPSPDTPAGAIGMVQQSGRTRVLTSLSWIHHDWKW